MAKLSFIIEVARNTSTSQVRVTFYKSLQVEQPFIRIYKEGSSAPSFVIVPSGSTYLWQYDFPFTSDYGKYIVEFKSSTGQQIIAKILILDPAVIVCNVSRYDIGSNPTGVGIHVLGYGNANPNYGKVSIGGSFKSLDTSTYAQWTTSEINALGYTTLIPTLTYKFVGACSDLAFATDIFVGAVSFAPLVVDYTVSNVTSNGGTDGGITLNITGGSGNLTYSWNDGPTTKDRTGLVAGTYTVTVTDTTTGIIEVIPIQVKEPEIEGTNGTLLTVPTLNSLTYVIQQAIDQCSNPQALDNVLLCQQEYAGFDETNYFQPVNKCDNFPTQFNSDFSQFEISLLRYRDSAFIKAFEYELKEQNIGMSQDFGITIRNHTGISQSRVYFNAGVIPIPLTVGDVFTILNNANGYNGNYSIVSILNDATLGYQYIVINKNFTGGPVENGTGRFVADNADFNVFEATHDFSDVPSGEYYIKIRAFSDNNEIIAVSEPIDVQVEHPDTNLIRYRNADNAFDFTWTTGYLGLLRVPSHFGHKRTPGGERSTSRNSDYSIVKINAKKTRVLLFETFNLPPYMHEKLSCAFDCDSYTINGITCNSSDAYGEPSYKDRFLLANSSIKVEAKWFGTYNSDDIGTVADGGFIKTETGFLRR